MWKSYNNNFYILLYFTIKKLSSDKLNNSDIFTILISRRCFLFILCLFLLAVLACINRVALFIGLFYFVLREMLFILAYIYHNSQNWIQYLAVFAYYFLFFQEKLNSTFNLIFSFLDRPQFVPLIFIVFLSNNYTFQFKIQFITNNYIIYISSSYSSSILIFFFFPQFHFVTSYIFYKFLSQPIHHRDNICNLDSILFLVCHHHHIFLLLVTFCQNNIRK
jgi:hypothetical protein